MSEFSAIDTELEVARRVCRPEDVEVLERKARGYGRRRGSLVLGITEETWRYRLRRGLAEVREAMRESEAA